jgi:tetratricopeptide (TPR) repeat protein
MADTGRLDELQRKFDENPRRYFAPLANEHRKAGDTARAIELCRTYLPHLPGHMSGYIVYGQALYDSGRGSEAASVFEEALRIDPENVIALRHLGDIARLSGDREKAVKWYQQVLELDPKNEEVAAYLDELAVGTPETETPEMHSSVSDVIDRQTSFDEMGMPALGTSAPVDSPSSEVLDAAIPAEPSGFDFDHSQAAEETAAFFEQSVAFEAPATDSDNIAIPPIEHSPMMGWEPTELIADAEATAAMFNEQIESLDLAPTIDSAEDRPEDSPEAASQEVPENQPPAATPFVTETMAELYVQQGMLNDALSVYKQLAAIRDEPELHEKIQALESELATTAAATAPSTATDTGLTIREFFARIGERRPESRAMSVAEAATRQHPSDLSAYFGSDQVDPNDTRAAQSLAGAFTQHS